MTPFRFIRYLLEAAGLLAGFLLIPLLPRSVVLLLANGLGSLSCRIARRDRLISEANIRLVFGQDIAQDKVDSMVTASFRCFALVMLDLFWFSFMTRRRVEKYVRIDSGYEWAFGDRPFVFLAAHMGNWEVLGLASALRTGRILSVAAPLENPVVDLIVKRIRRKTGQVIIDKQGAMRQMLRELKNNGKVGLVIDQNTRPAEGGCFVDLFGLPAPVSLAAASLILHAGCDAGFVCGVPDGKGCYDALMIERFPAEDSLGLTQEELTARIARAIEKVVRRNPEYWLWAYKRWKYLPEGALVEKFPFYSRPL